MYLMISLFGYGVCLVFFLYWSIDILQYGYSCSKREKLFYFNWVLIVFLLVTSITTYTVTAPYTNTIDMTVTPIQNNDEYSFYTGGEDNQKIFTQNLNVDDLKLLVITKKRNAFFIGADYFSAHTDVYLTTGNEAYIDSLRQYCETYIDTTYPSSNEATNDYWKHRIITGENKFKESPHGKIFIAAVILFLLNIHRKMYISLVNFIRYKKYYNRDRSEYEKYSIDKYFEIPMNEIEDSMSYNIFKDTQRVQTKLERKFNKLKV
jgi:hypothetical protein